jgi:microsomal dipeptidase-like Zn-dependent dipeptidase
MIEKTVCDYLNDVMGLPAFWEKPEDMTEEFLIVEKTGGRLSDRIKTATIAIQSYAGSMYRAAEINDAVIHAMDHLVEYDGVSRVQLNSDYNYTDTTTKQYRYQAVFDITHY